MNVFITQFTLFSWSSSTCSDNQDNIFNKLQFNPKFKLMIFENKFNEEKYNFNHFNHSI